MVATPPPKEKGSNPVLAARAAEPAADQEVPTNLVTMVNRAMAELRAEIEQGTATNVARAKGTSEQLPATPVEDEQAVEQASQEEVIQEKPIGEEASEEDLIEKLAKQEVTQEKPTGEKADKEKSIEKLVTQEHAAQQEPVPEEAFVEVIHQESSQQPVAQSLKLAITAKGAAEEGGDHVEDMQTEAGSSQAHLVKAAAKQGGLHVNLPLETGTLLELPISDGQRNAETVYSASSNAESPKSARTGSDSAVLVAGATFARTKAILYY